MDQDFEEIFVPRETEGFPALRRWGLAIFLSISIAMLIMALSALLVRS